MTGRILVVDGVPTNRITMKVRLTTACYEVMTASTGQEALRIVRLMPPQLILIGTNLSDICGPMLCAALRALPMGGDIPVLVVASGQDRVAALKAGASALIDPNGDDLTLLARIRGLIRHEYDKAETAGHPEMAGMAEGAQAFQHDTRPRAIFVADQPATALAWRHAMQARVNCAITVCDADRALSDAAAGKAADLYLLASDMQQTGDGLRLLSELRSRAGSRDAAFVVALRPDRADMLPIVLDLGAGDVLPWDLAQPDFAPEAAMRLSRQLDRKHHADQRRREGQRNMRWAMIDPLTGLHNRRFALPLLSDLVVDAHNTQQDVAVMVLDLDRFKMVNDIHGHAAGDAVLSEVAARLTSVLPESALLARIGGEEFLTVLPDCPAQAARRVAEDLRHAIMADPIVLPPGCELPQIYVTASVGVAIGHPGMTHSMPPDPQALLASADRALLNAKTSGRNRIVMAPQMVAA